MKVIRENWIWALVIIGLFILLHVILPYGAILGGELHKFVSPDDYYQAQRVMDRLAIFPALSDISQVYPWGIAALIWLLSLGHPTRDFAEIIIASLPVLLSLLTLIPVFAIARMLFGKTAAIISVLAFVVIPGEYLGRSLLGAPDTHVFEVLLSTGVMASLLYVAKYREKAWLWGTLAAVIMVIYILVWRGAILFVVIAAVSVATIAFLELKSYLRILIMVISGAIGVAFIYLVISYLLTPGIMLNTEVRSVFAQPWNPWLMLHVLLSGFLCYQLFKTARGKYDTGSVIFLVWSVMVVLATAIQRRFDYYMAVNLAILLGWGFVIFAEKAKAKLLALTFLTVVMLIVCLPTSINEAKSMPFVITDDMAKSFNWIRQQDTTLEDRVLVWWDYGYAARYMTGHYPLSTGSQTEWTVRDTADILVAKDYPQELLRKDEIRYIVLNDITVNHFYTAITSWAGEKPQLGTTFMYRLYNGAEYENVSKVFESGGVKVWQVAE